MKLSRRDFLKLSGASVGGALIAGKANLSSLFPHPPKTIRLKNKVSESTTICCYCAVGCGALVQKYKGGRIVVEGDPEHPINEGTLCPKGMALAQLHQVDGKPNSRRLTKVQHRAPYSDHWEEMSWEEAIPIIARNIKNTRDNKGWVERDEKVLVNRTESIANLGGAGLDNEECYLLSKLARTLGIVYLEHQARICHSSTVAALAESFGRGAMTNHWIDMRNSDCVFIIGSNAAENHPMSFHWVMKAKEKGAKVIHVDPRFTRTSARADIYAPIRAGTDIAFVGGMINYVLNDIERNPNNYNMTYVREYTNASLLIDPNFKGPADLGNGLFEGFKPGSNGNAGSYDKSTWKYQLDENGIPKRDKTLKNPNCVFQLLKKHYARYTVDKVRKITGTHEGVYRKICQTYAETGRTGKSGTILYAMGATQHTYGVQHIRTYAILQLLLANIGVAGGGINALRGESNVQGSTDHCLLFHILPGYLKVPVNTDENLDVYLKRVTPTTKDPLSANWWGNYKKYAVSLLKAWYGDAATKDNDFGFNWLPKIKLGKDYSHIPLFEDLDKGIIKGMLIWGQNPAVGGPNANLERKAMGNLEWLVAMDLWETETASFWKRPGVDPTTIDTEVFLLPAAASYEKEGSITNSGRWMQWRYKAVEPPGEAKSDLEVMYLLGKELKRLYELEGGKNAEAIAALTWDYKGNAEEPITPDEVAKEINGYDLTTGKLVPSFGKLKDDGTTSSGNWLYCASYVEPDDLDSFEKKHLDMFKYIGNRATRRYPLDVGNGGYSDKGGYKKVGFYSYWSWCWPVNRRIIYNRASVDLSGKPWDSRYPIVKFTGESLAGKYVSNEWVGDVPDGGWYPLQNPDGTWRDDAKLPFIMKPEGVSRLFGMGLEDGPFPEHYEPWESPVENMMSAQQIDPAAVVWRPEERGWKPGDGENKFPYVATTYRLVEHWQAGAMTRNLPWLVELMPNMFAEIDEELAREKGIKNGEKVVVESMRGKIEIVAIVTKRLKPLRINGGQIVHQVGLPWHWGYNGLAKGYSANCLTPHIGDANTTIPEYKAFLCNIYKA